MEELKNRTVADVVAENIKTAKVFNQHGIDFCCGGGISIEAVCQKYKIDLLTVVNELEEVDKGLSNQTNYNSWELGRLIDHIVAKHHAFVEERTPAIIQYSNKVASVHGKSHPEVVKINQLFHEVANELIPHLKKEELILFPYVKRLIEAKREEIPTPHAPFGSVNNPIQMMNDEHEGAGDIFKEIAVLSNNYTPPAEACNTFKALYDELQNFEKDLHVHIHLENNILFPKAIVLEQEFEGK